MDYVPSPESFCAPDYFKSIFTASPSSPYMYEQERQDSVSSFHGARSMFGQSGTTTDFAAVPSVDPEFDLHPHYENSNNLAGFIRVDISDSMMQSGACESRLGEHRGSVKEDLELTTISDHDLLKLKPESTLTEIGIDPYLFEGVEGVILSDNGKLPRETALSAHVESIKKEMSSGLHSDFSPKTFTQLENVRNNQSAVTQQMPARHQSQFSSNPASLSELARNRTHNVAIVTPIPVTTNTPSPTPFIKMEPGDMNPPSYNSSMLTSSPHQDSRLSPPGVAQSSPPGNRQVMPVVPVSRPPPLSRHKSGSVEEKWKEIEMFINHPAGDGASKGGRRKRHISEASSTQSDDDTGKRQRMDSSDEDSDSDDDSDFNDTPFEESLVELAKKSKQFFWQYNVQAKGPKGTRLPLTINDMDPHRVSNFEDPVFDANNTSLVGIRHGGKARKGDGNVVTPNPRKLYQIGQKLCRLNREINNVQLATSLPASVRIKSRKEKNKLSSRACRLKKKAQHEANKVKLFGLTTEHSELLDVVRLTWPKLKERARQQMKENIPSALSSDSLALHINHIISTHYKTATAGNTTDYVNQVIARVEEGDPTGGLNIKLKVKK